MMNLTEMYIELRDPIYRYLLRLCGNHNLAEELTQETFCRALMALPKFRREASLKTWLYAIARNTYLSKMRSKGNDFLNLDEEFLSSEANHADPADQLIEDEQRRLMRKAVHSLPEAYRTVIILKEFEELSYEEISTILEKSETWVRVTFFRAKQKLKEIYTDAEGRKEVED